MNRKNQGLCSVPEQMSSASSLVENKSLVLFQFIDHFRINILSSEKQRNSKLWKCTKPYNTHTSRFNTQRMCARSSASRIFIRLVLIKHSKRQHFNFSTLYLSTQSRGNCFCSMFCRGRSTLSYD